MWQSHYKKSDSSLWQGRLDKGAKSIRYHQVVELVDFSKTSKS